MPVYYLLIWYTMDDHSSLKQPPRPEEGAMDEGITPLRHYPNPLDEGKTASS